jgi:hypothetical protein
MSEGVPGLLACTEPFVELARGQAAALGRPELPLVTLEHPVGGLPDEEVDLRAARALPQLRRLLDPAAPAGDTSGEAVLRLVTEPAPGEPAELVAHLAEAGLSDGLPVVAPTPARVAEMLAGHAADPRLELGQLPPRYGPVTAELVASCAVMAGCRPAYLPVVLAALRAMLDPSFNAGGIQTTTHPAAPLAIVSGPLADELGMNSGTNAFGPGNHANATIGRAIRLCMLALGGAVPGVGDMATMGSPAKYGYVVAENRPASPWGTLASSLGFAEDADTVTVLGAEAPHNVNDHESADAGGLLEMIAGTMRITGMNNNYYDSDVLLALCPEHAAMLSRDGFTRAGVQRHLHEAARTPLGHFSKANVDNRLRRKFPEDFAAGPPESVPAVRRAEGILLCVIGGPGKHSMYVPSFGGTRAVTVTIA